MGAGPGAGARGQPLSCGQKFDLPALEFCIIQVSFNLVGRSSIYLLMLNNVTSRTTTITSITELFIITSEAVIGEEQVE